MRNQPFRSFLLNNYRGIRSGRPLGERPTSDAVSRCRRVERSLGVNLDEVLANVASPDRFIGRVEASVGAFGIREVVASHRYAAQPAGRNDKVGSTQSRCHLLKLPSTLVLQWRIPVLPA